MNDQSSTQPPEFVPEVQTTQKTYASGYKIPVLLILWPIVGVVGAVVLYAVIAYFSPPAQEFEPQAPLRTAMNVILFLVGAASVALGPISCAVGVALLIIRRSNKKRHNRA